MSLSLLLTLSMAFTLLLQGQNSSASVTDFFTQSTEVETAADGFLVAGSVEQNAIVKLNGNALPRENVPNGGGFDVFASVVPLIPGLNNLTLTVTPPGGDEYSKTSVVTYTPGLNLRARPLVFVDLVPNGSSQVIDGTAVIDTLDSSVLGILEHRHIRGISPDWSELYFSDGTVVDAGTLEPLRTLPFTNNLEVNTFVVSPTGATLFNRSEQVDVQSNTLGSPLPIDISISPSVFGRVTAGGPGISAQGDTICGQNPIACFNTGTLDVTTPAFTSTNAFKTDIAIREDLGLLFIVSFGGGVSGKVTAFDLSTFDFAAATVNIGDFAGQIEFFGKDQFVFGNSGNPVLGGGGVALYEIEQSNTGTFLRFQDFEHIPFADNLAQWGNIIFASSGGVSSDGDRRYGVDVLTLGEDDKLIFEQSFFLGANVSADQVRKIVFKPALPELPGDYDNNGLVAGNDFLVWQRQFGSVIDSFELGADGNSDGFVNAGDLSVWQQRFGSALQTVPSLAVPEPGNGLTAIVGLFALLSRELNRKRPIKRTPP